MRVQHYEHQARSENTINMVFSARIVRRHSTVTRTIDLQDGVFVQDHIHWNRIYIILYVFHWWGHVEDSVPRTLYCTYHPWVPLVHTPMIQSESRFLLFLLWLVNYSYEYYCTWRHGTNMDSLSFFSKGVNICFWLTIPAFVNCRCHPWCGDGRSKSKSAAAVYCLLFTDSTKLF